MLVAISECDSLCRPRHSICLQLLIKHIAYVHRGIPSYPSVKSLLLLLLLLPLPIAPFSCSPPSLLPLSPSPSSPCPPLHCQPHPVPIPIAPFPISPFAPFQIPPPCLHPPVATTPHPPFLPSTLSHFPPLPAFGPCQPLRILFPKIDSNQCMPY